METTLSFGNQRDASSFGIKAGGIYDYKMPGWDRPTRVTVEQGTGDFSDQLLIRFSKDRFPTRLSEIPVAAIFTEVSSEAVIS